MSKKWITMGAFFLGQATLAVTSVRADGPALPAGSAASGAPAQPSLMMNLVPFVGMFAVIYFLMIRPQQKKVKEQQDMLSQLKKGDEVVTNAGILGTVAGITEKVVTLEVADNVRLKMLKSQVSQVMKAGQLKELT